MITYTLKESNNVTRHANIGRNFPGGEVNVAVQPHSYPEKVSEVSIQASMQSSDELMQFIMFVDATRRMFRNAKIVAAIPYLPYARQDRVCNEGEALSVAALANILNNIAVDEYKLYDPHSDVSSALLKRVEVIPQTAIFAGAKQLIMNINYDAIIAPDAGAQKKAYKIAEYFEVDRVITANKFREVSTGRIKRVELTEPVDGLNVAVFDDICDGGATFIELAKHLAGAKVRDLYVTHGIFSKGVDNVAKHYDRVFTTNSYNPTLSAVNNLVVNKYFYN